MQKMLIDSQDKNYAYFEEINPGIINFFNLIGSNKKILDVGCGSGLLGQALKNKNNYVIGLDLSEQAISLAKSRLNEAYICDITNQENLNFLEKNSFDYIIFADVLEHLYNPEKILKNFSNLLKPGGHIIVSLPNIACWSIRLKLLFGNFQYQETGILDKTHIRFFTKKTAIKLLEQTGFLIEKINITPYFARSFLSIVRKYFLKKSDNKKDPGIITNSGAYKNYIKWVYPAESLVAKVNKNLFAFQFVFYARKK